jgi:CDP-diacylglycerol---glycerol-3-phosphate 3-phosphatidyltransferase
LRQMKRHLPFALTTLRLLLGPVALVCAFAQVAQIVYLPILAAGTLSDIFDGILARRFGVSTPRLRRYDSVTDIIYYLFLLVVAWILCRPVMVHNFMAIALLLSSEAAVILVSFARFRRYPAVHSYLAKFYGLCLLAAITALLVFHASGWVIVALTAVALVTNAESFLIHCLVNSPPVDVRSVLPLFKGSEITETEFVGEIFAGRRYSIGVWSTISRTTSFARFSSFGFTRMRSVPLMSFAKHPMPTSSRQF